MESEMVRHAWGCAASRVISERISMWIYRRRGGERKGAEVGEGVGDGGGRQWLVLETAWEDRNGRSLVMSSKALGCSADVCGGGKWSVGLGIWTVVRGSTSRRCG